MLVFITFVNGFHYWPVIKQFPPCLNSTPFIRMVRIHTFWVVWIEDLGPTVASSFCYCPSCARPRHTLYDILLRHRSTLYSCGYDRLLSMDPPCSFVAMAPLDLIWRLFCILSDHDSFISYTYVGSACIFMAMFCTWTCMSERLVFLTFISLSGTFVRAFRSWILCSLHTQLFPL